MVKLATAFSLIGLALSGSLMMIGMKRMSNVLKSLFGLHGKLTSVAQSTRLMTTPTNACPWLCDLSQNHAYLKPKTEFQLCPARVMFGYLDQPYTTPISRKTQSAAACALLAAVRNADGLSSSALSHPPIYAA